MSERPSFAGQVRAATPSDLPAVATIFTHYVLKTTATFATSVRTPAVWQQRYRDKVGNGPYTMLVATRGGAVAGYVETSRFRPQDSYDTAIETSIYVAPDQGGNGVGTALYTELFRQLESSGLHRAFAVIALPNPSSIRIHERFGFIQRGVLTEAGRKFGRWLDVAYLERPL